MSDTIFAVSSGALPAGIAVLRISGPGALAAAQGLAGSLPEPRRAALRRLRDPDGGDALDRALVLVFPGPGSVTGEDLVELHLHGARAVAADVGAALARMPGVRAAEAGEFTRRALLNGRIDLSEAEGLGDLLAAETSAQRRAALAASEGGIRRAVEGWTDRLLALSARLEAALDHADEEDVAADDDVLDSVRAGAGALAGVLGEVLSAPPVERLRDGLRVVLAGPPNAGKSTLLNALADREAAIVSPLPGTTRDRIEVAVQRNGIAWVLTDTAGLREDTSDPIEAIGIARAGEAIEGADLLLWLDDAVPPRGDALAIYPRCDVRGLAPAGRLAVSAATGFGIAALWERMEAAAAAMLPHGDQLAFNRRQRGWMAQAAEALHEAALQRDWLLCAEELRRARAGFDAITGRAGTEQLLDDLFGRFCIGK